MKVEFNQCMPDTPPDKIEKTCSPITCQIFAQTDTGMVRETNEDNFLIVDLASQESWIKGESSSQSLPLTLVQPQAGLLFAVADGMGGALAGEVASHLAVTGVRDEMFSLKTQGWSQNYTFAKKLTFSIENANQLIYQESITRKECAGMGTTFTAAGIEDGMLYLAQVGDSRAYLFRQNQITQLTRDQTLVEELLSTGQLTPIEARNHPCKNIILQALGSELGVTVIVGKLALCQDDVILVCSDGLSGKLLNKDLGTIIQNWKHDLPSAGNQMVQLANLRGGEDNTTVILIHVSGGELPEAKALELFERNFLAEETNLSNSVEPALPLSSRPPCQSIANFTAQVEGEAP